jgi:PAS domain S-box-containing protein
MRQEPGAPLAAALVMNDSLEARLQATLNVIPAYTWYAAPTGALTFVNERAADYAGLPTDHALRFGIDTGAAWDSHIALLHPDEHDEARRVWSNCLRTGLAGEITFRVRSAQGVYRWFISRAEPLRASDGTLLLWIGINFDVEERKQAEFFLAEGQRLDQERLMQAVRKSEEALRLVVNGIGALVTTYSADGELEFVNQQVLDFFGKTLEELKDWRTNDSIHPDDLDRVVVSWANSLATGHPYEDVHRYRRFDGVYRWFRSCGRPARDVEGRVIRWYVLLTDIDDIKKAEEKLAEQERELRQVLDLAPQLMAVLGPNLERLYANSGALAYFGTTLDGWRRNDVESEVHPDDLERVRAAAERGLLTRSTYELEKRIRMSDGTYRWFLARYKALCDSQGLVTRWYVACTDIEDRKQAEERLQEENVALREEIDKTSMFEEIVGTSPALNAVLSLVSKVAGSDSTVLITGETGTGKELVARAIHRRSGRSSKAFVAVNCAAIPRELIASELFGHEKGAFTGALQRRLGRFELADGGTIFLDEVAELSPDTQAALLRVLQEREFVRVGGRETIHVDVRVIAATNRDLSDAVAGGTFRQDLFYRLNVFPLEMPSLRDRKQDIPVLVEYFIHRYALKAHKTFRRVNKRTLNRLQSYPWPGNVRELQNVIQRSVIVCDTDEFTVDESWLSTGPKVESAGALSSKLAAYEKAIIEEALRASGGQVFGPAGAAAQLRIPRSTLESRIRALRINKSRFRPRPT